ncbi:MAG: aspartyl/glutamyl-tRNA amidotransferase subunit C [Actinomycetota bacterium]|nr:aspartyl/glutamyl-tRNA amidotransferase subunit C [Actinomycetota bacterium]
MAGFTREDVRRLGTLARLELTEDEVSLFADQLSVILAFAAEVESADAPPLPAESVTAPLARAALREDELRDSLRLDDVLDSAPKADRDAGLITVPRVFNA